MYNSSLVSLLKIENLRISIIKRCVFLCAYLVVGGSLLVSGPILAKDVAAKRKGVKVFQEPSKKSTVVKKLSKGEVVEAIERKGMYWQIKLQDGNKGFVSVMKVKLKKSNKNNGISGALRDAVQKGRLEEDDPASSRARSTVMGVRGLDESEDAQFAGNVKPNLRMVYSMEEFSVKASSLESLENQVQNEIESRISAKSKKPSYLNRRK